MVRERGLGALPKNEIEKPDGQIGGEGVVLQRRERDADINCG